MAYDVFAFDLFAAPRDRHDFLHWISSAFRGGDGPIGNDPQQLTPALQAWLRDVSQSFPPASPHMFSDDDENGSRYANYRMIPNAIQASFDWEACGPALHRAKRAAQAHGVGLFEASGHEATVWMMSSRGRWEAVHRNDQQFGHG